MQFHFVHLNCVTLNFTETFCVSRLFVYTFCSSLCINTYIHTYVCMYVRMYYNTFVLWYLYNYSSPNIVRVIKSRRMRWAGHVARMGEERGVCRVLLGKPEGSRPLGRPKRRWVGNIRVDLQEVGCGYMDWIGLAQDRDRWWTLVSVVMNLRVP